MGQWRIRAKCDGYDRFHSSRSQSSHRPLRGSSYDNQKHVRPDSAVSKCDTAVDPATEHALGYLALAAEVIALVIVAIGFYKLGKLLSH
jgi:hypothetical protein